MRTFSGAPHLACAFVLHCRLSSLAIHSQDEFGGEGYEPNSTSHGLGGEFELDEGESEEGGDDDDDF